MKKQKYKSELLGVIYEDALADYELGIITEELMHEYEQGCLVPEVSRVSFSANDAPVRRPSPIAAHSAQ